jgi:hypothetical protein
MVERSDYGDSAWISLIKDELIRGRPVYYSGDGNNNEAGHAFDVDGFNAQNYFHLNWGWSGQYNGYYSLSALNPGGYQFNYNQQAVINIMPRNHQPTDILLSNNDIYENDTIGAKVGEVAVVDETPGDSFSFEVFGPENIFGEYGKAPFKVDSNNQLVTTEVLDYSHKSEYDIFIKVIDKQGYTFTKKFQIQVMKSLGGTGIRDNGYANSGFKVYGYAGELNYVIDNSYKGNITLEIYNLAGRMVYNDQLIKSEDQLSGSISLPFEGLYLMRIGMENAYITRKIYIGK